MQPILKRKVSLVKQSDFDVASIMNPNERVVFEKYVDKINKEIQAKQEQAKKLKTDRLSQRQLAGCNGIRSVVLKRRKQEQA